MALFRVFMFWALRHISAIDGGLITATTPGVMALLAFFLLKEIPDRRRTAGILLAVAGVAVMHWQIAPQNGSISGCLLMVVATVCESMLTIFRKMEKVPVPPMANTFYIVTFSILFLIPATIVEAEWERLFYLQINELAGCMYMGIMATVVAYWCWGYASTRLDAGVTGIITAIMPLSATVISVVVLGESMGNRHLTGGTCVLLSLLVITQKRARNVRPNQCV